MHVYGFCALHGSDNENTQLNTFPSGITHLGCAFLATKTIFPRQPSGDVLVNALVAAPVVKTRTLVTDKCAAINCERWERFVGE